MKRLLLMICAVLTMVSNTMADDSFSVDDVSLPQNAEADVVVRFSLDQGSTCSGYSFYLQVPDELEFVMNAAGTRVEYVAGDSYSETPTITPNLSDGYLKVACLNANSDPLVNQAGTLVTFKVKVKDDATVTVGDVLTGHLTNVQISAESGSVHDAANADFTITITEPADLRTILDETSTVAPESATGVDVRVKRTLKANSWNTICLPFAIPAEKLTAAFGQGVEVKDFTSWSSDEDDETGDIIGLTIGFTPVTAMEANHPYLIKVLNAISEFTVDGVDINPVLEPATVVGKGKKKGSFYGTYVANTTVPEYNLFVSNDKFYYSDGSTKMKAFRGYFELYDYLSVLDEADARINIVDGDATGISDVRTYSVGNNDYYDLQGRKVEHPSKGLYIINNKKVVIK